MSARDSVAQQARREALRRYAILDTQPEEAFDRLTRLASMMLGAPIALIGLTDGDRHWFKSRIGITIEEIPLEDAFCRHTVEDGEVVIVENAALDPRFRDHPMVTGGLRMRFYAGAPLRVASGIVIGSICVVGLEPRRVAPAEVAALRDLAALVVDQLELRSTASELAHELSERKEVERARRETEARLIAAIESLPFDFWLTDIEGRCVLQNTLDRRTWGDARGRKLEDTTSDPRVRERWAASNRRALAGEIVRSEEHYEVNGRLCEVEEIVAPVRLDNTIIGLVGVNIDLTGRKRTEAALELAQRRLQSLASSGVVGIIYGEGSRIVEANDAFLHMLGLDDAGPTGGAADRASIILPGSDAFGAEIISSLETVGKVGPMETECRRADGGMVPVLFAAALAEPAPLRWIAVVQDITVRKAAEARIRELADTDALTGLANRRSFLVRLQHDLSELDATTLGGVLILDLDHFKEVNDTLGHDAGDAVLREIGQRLLTKLRPTDMVARLGGDEFAIILRDLRAPADARIVGEEILKAIAGPLHYDGQELHFRASLGATLFPTDGTDASQLLKNADIALYQAKGQGRGVFSFFDCGLRVELERRRTTALALRRSLVRGDFELVYQPLLNLADGSHRGFEALLRWRHGGTLISPGAFLPIAEETGLIVPIGRFVLREALDEMRRWLDAGFEPGQVAVNVAAAQLKTVGFCTEVAQFLRERDLAPERLEIEITENVLLDRGGDQVAATLRGLDRLGVTIALDDFGTGYASLSHLKRFPVDRLKIDRTFVRDLGADPDDAAIARSIVHLAHTLGMQVVAEGIETAEQLDFLRQNRCDVGQGFLFAPGLPAHDVAAYLFGQQPLGSEWRTATAALG